MDAVLVIAQMALAAFLVTAALWQGSKREGVALYAFAGAVSISTGLAWTRVQTNPEGYVLSVIFVGIGIYLFILAVWNLIIKIRGRR